MGLTIPQTSIRFSALIPFHSKVDTDREQGKLEELGSYLYQEFSEVVLQKLISHALAPGIGSCVVQPRRIQLLEVKMKEETEMLLRLA